MLPSMAQIMAIGKELRVKKSGFTLIEVLVAIALVGMLASIAVYSHRNSARKGREQVLRHNLAQLRLTLDQYNNDKGHYPESLNTLQDEGYLRRIPEDPFTRSRETWEELFEEDYGDEDSSYVPGVFDVRSGSEEKALDGTFYNEW